MATRGDLERSTRLLCTLALLACQSAGLWLPVGVGSARATENSWTDWDSSMV